MKRILFALLLVLVALGVLLWRFPASAMLAFVPTKALQSLAPHLSMHELDGTLWRGRVRLTAAAIPSTLSLQWDCAPKPLSLSIECALSESVSGRVTISPSSQSLNVADLKSVVPLRFVAPGSTVISSDAVSIAVASAEFANTKAKVTATLTASNATSQTGSTALPLGEVSVDCAPIDSAPASRCTLRNRNAENRVDGDIEFGPQRATGSVVFTPSGGSAQRMSF
ncbi:MAG: hypothetical protein EAZ30_00140 [Betaproteobacteria bacterium]|nr:MAG: hypothetical protein EAZ30_00140 [Betaproteobacteria bacterium]